MDLGWALGPQNSMVVMPKAPKFHPWKSTRSVSKIGCLMPLLGSGIRQGEFSWRQAFLHHASVRVFAVTQSRPDCPPQMRLNQVKAKEAPT
jgi:hypothetical protein